MNAWPMCTKTSNYNAHLLSDVCSWRLLTCRDLLLQLPYLPAPPPVLYLRSVFADPGCVCGRTPPDPSFIVCVSVLSSFPLGCWPGLWELSCARCNNKFILLGTLSWMKKKKNLHASNVYIVLKPNDSIRSLKYTMYIKKIAQTKILKQLNLQTDRKLQVRREELLLMWFLLWW